jgi:hypothetical protein
VGIDDKTLGIGPAPNTSEQPRISIQYLLNLESPQASGYERASGIGALRVAVGVAFGGGESTVDDGMGRI